ncbi:HvfC/BufC family peptide modification chaperone [Paraburkholderia sp. GAS334]|uniref:HvfC/BufC family peptide modification chaperone n=1 Tax=Paraburkholderia sp. GAS334 TaxID=3035131 RepID=UPI003D239D8E
MPRQLELLQQTFASALLDAEHERPLLERVKPVPPTAGLGSAQVNAGVWPGTQPHIAAGSDFGDHLRRRIGLYRGNVRAHWRAALANAYPVLLALVGGDYFEGLSHAYACAHPSHSGDLNRFGEALPTFIDRYEQNPRFRYFADVAQLEWSLHVAHFAADVTSFTPQQWLDIGHERLLDARFVVHPACTAIASRYAVADIWFAHQPGRVFPERLDVPTWMLVVRPLWQPTILVQSAAAHATFIAMQLGKSLNEALDAAFALDPEFDFTSQWQKWISAAAIASPVISTGEPRVLLPTL